MKSVTQSAAMITSVVAAFFASGGLKAGTPFEIASTPVMAVQPLAKARSTRKVVSGRRAAGAGSGGGPGLTVAREHAHAPTASRPSMATRKK